MEEQDKEIIVNLAFGKVSYENQFYLCKFIDQKFLNRTFNELLIYMVDPREDRLNPGYSEDEIALAKKIRHLRENSQSPFRLRFIDKNGNVCPPVKLEEKISDYFNEMAKDKERFIEAMVENIPYKQVDLIVDSD